MLSSITSQKTYYEILSVGEDADIDEIRTGYKTALLNTHPDKLPKQPDLSRPHSNEREFLVVQKAWEILSNSQSKSQYDKELAASRRKLDIISNEIELEDMNIETNSDGVYELVYPCRCGDYFGISSVTLKEMGILLGENGEVQINGGNFVPVSVVLQCGSCSLKEMVPSKLKFWKDVTWVLLSTLSKSVMPCLTNEAHFKLPSIRCKSLPSLLKSCISTPSYLSSEDEDTYYDLDTKHLILKELRNRAMRASSKRNEHFYSADLTLFIPPSLENTDRQKDFQDVTDNEDESEAFFSMKSNFSRCSSQGATASWDEKKGATAYQSVLEEFNHLEGWPFGLCRRPLVLPPLPNMPADPWMWRRRKSETKFSGVVN